MKTKTFKLTGEKVRIVGMYRRTFVVVFLATGQTMHVFPSQIV